VGGFAGILTNTALKLYLSQQEREKLASWGKTGTEDFQLIRAIKTWIDGLPHAIDRNV